MPLASDAFTEQGGAYSRDSFLAGGINISYNKDVGIGKSRDEFLEQGFCSRIAVGLEHHDFPSAPGLSYRSKSRPDLRRMVAVIIQNGNVDRHLTQQFILVEDGKKGPPSGVYDFARPVVRTGS